MTPPVPAEVTPSSLVLSSGQPAIEPALVDAYRHLREASALVRGIPGLRHDDLAMALRSVAVAIADRAADGA